MPLRMKEICKKTLVCSHPVCFGVLLREHEKLLTFSVKIELLQLFGDVITKNSQPPHDDHVTVLSG